MVTADGSIWKARKPFSEYSYPPPVTVTWTALTGDDIGKNADGTAAEIEKYTVYYEAVATGRTFTANVKTRSVTDVTKTSATITGLTAGTGHIFAVAATGASQEGLKSDAVEATPTTP